MIKRAIIGALGVISLGVPGISTAQAYSDQGYSQGYGQNYRQTYGQSDGDRGQDGYGDHGPDRGYDGERRGDYDNRYGGYGGDFEGYPEFRGLEQHIRSEIFQSLRQDMIDRDGAQDLLAQLRQIKMDQAREFQHHGWRLPGDDRYRIRSAYERLDREVDRLREEPEG